MKTTKTTPALWTTLTENQQASTNGGNAPLPKLPGSGSGGIGG